MEALGSKNISIHSLKGNLRGSQVMPEPSLPDYVTIYVTIINIIIFVVGVVGNVLVIVVVAKVKDMRTNINLYLVNLSVADLLVLLVCQPTAMLEFYAKERWYLGAFVCKLIPVLEHTVLHASTLTIVVISLERYHAICRSLTKFLRCSRPKPLVVLMCIWTIAFLFSFPFLLMTTLKDAQFFDGTPCKLCSTEVNRMWHYCFLLLTTAIFFVLPLFLLAALYSNIIRTLYRSDIIEGRVSVNLKDATGYSLRSRRQVIRMLIALIILFFISLAPLRIVIIWQVFSPPESVVDLGIESYYNLIWLCRMMMYLNSAGNPLIYSLLSCKFKIAFFFLLRCQSHMLDRRSRQRPHALCIRDPNRNSYMVSLQRSISNGSNYKSAVSGKYSHADISKIQSEQITAMLSKNTLVDAEDNNGSCNQDGEDQNSDN